MSKRIFVADYALINSRNGKNLEEELKKLLASDVDEILVKPLLMSNGFEMSELKRRVLAFNENCKKQNGAHFKKITFALPVLAEKKSAENLAKILSKEVGFKSSKTYVFVGHGLPQSQNQEYFDFEDILHSLGYENVYVALLTGKGNVNDFLSRIKKAKIRKISVFPLLINLGHHVEHDIFGETEPNANSEEKSFCQILTENGIDVEKNYAPLSKYAEFKESYLDETNI